tara:strand:- start:56 stop:322 length:267 start_codon:yes stop_codon:yes gene_type:complete
MENKVIYLKSLFKNFKPKPEKFTKEILEELKRLDIDLISGEKPVDIHADKKAGRDFILAHTEEFLNHVIDYSMYDRIKDVWGSPKDLA